MKVAMLADQRIVALSCLKTMPAPQMPHLLAVAQIGMIIVSLLSPDRGIMDSAMKSAA
jgi:ABC-type polysaccharide transport system permease subunit